MAKKKAPWFKRGRTGCQYVVTAYGHQSTFVDPKSAADFAAEIRRDRGPKVRVVAVGNCKRRAYRPKRRR